MAPFNSLFKQSVRQWSKSRLRLADINNDQSYQLTPKKINFENQVIIKSELYEFTCGIYLDKNEINDSVFYTSATLINLDHSFYYLNPNHFSDCLLNIVFDLVEIERQRMSQDLTLKPWTFNQVDSIYAATSSRADFNVNQFIKETEHGNASLKMKNYIETIDMILGVDNLSIINTLDFEFSDTASNIDITEIYNAGTTLLQLGKFASALEVFKVGEAEGDKHPWLYYNIGICYYKLDQPNLACQFFQIAFELDEPIADIYSQLCFNYK